MMELRLQQSTPSISLKNGEAKCKTKACINLILAHFSAPSTCYRWLFLPALLPSILPFPVSCAISKGGEK
jgi:hypothetical protein